MYYIFQITGEQKMEKFSENMEICSENPWMVENIQAFNFLCCPECLYKSKNELLFKNHAVQCHPKSSILFYNLEQNDVKIIEDIDEFTEDSSHEQISEMRRNFDISEIVQDTKKREKFTDIKPKVENSDFYTIDQGELG